MKDAGATTPGMLDEQWSGRGSQSTPRRSGGKLRWSAWTCLIGSLLVQPLYVGYTLWIRPNPASDHRSLQQELAVRGGRLDNVGSLCVDSSRLLAGDAEPLLGKLVDVQNVSVTLRRLSRAEIEQIALVPRIRRLSIFGAEVGSDGFAPLNDLELESLGLCAVRCSASGWRSLATFRSLRELRFVSADIDRESVAHLRSRLPDCQIVVEQSSRRAGPASIVETRFASSRGSSDTLRMATRGALARSIAYIQSCQRLPGCYAREWPFNGDEAASIASQICLKPPAAPQVGLACLEAYRVTGDSSMLDAAAEVAGMLLYTQLESGGWGKFAELDPVRRLVYGYRKVPRGDVSNASSLDDRITQDALRLLMELDAELKGPDKEVREAVRYGLDRILESQFPNGAWSQWVKRGFDTRDYPVKRASYPEHWSRTRSFKGYSYYRYHYTLNDGLMPSMIRLMLRAAEVYQDVRYRKSAIRAGDFLLLAQMPDPQPGWAQQYNSDMHPSWGRSFEPPAVTGGESQGVIGILLELSCKTGERRFADAAKRAIDYFQRSRLPDGRLARFYELETNRPLYMDRRYRLSYADDNILTHYSYRSSDHTPTLRAAWERLANGLSDDSSLFAAEPPSDEDVREILARQEQNGAWVDATESGRMVRLRTFLTNAGILTQYLATHRRSPGKPGS